MTSTSGRKSTYLQEMGIGPVWKRRQPEDSTPPQDHAGTPRAAEVDEMPLLRQSASPEISVADYAGQVGHAPSAVEVATMNWIELKASVADCVKCNLCHGRTKTVFGVGDENAKWLFVGEGPGRNEDLQGEPFVGPAGKLLDNMLAAMGLKRGQNAYIANIVKCRPRDENGKDRPPTPDEAAACMPYLNRQIELIQPTIIVALGKTAAISLLNADPATPVSKLRSAVHRYAGRPLIVTYHPAYLLRNPADKRKSWADLCLAMQTYGDAGAS
jgi:uracil-DNA glycosylase family 4